MTESLFKFNKNIDSMCVVTKHFLLQCNMKMNQFSSSFNLNMDSFILIAFLILYSCETLSLLCCSLVYKNSRTFHIYKCSFYNSLGFYSNQYIILRYEIARSLKAV